MSYNFICFKVSFNKTWTNVFASTSSPLSPSNTLPKNSQLKPKTRLEVPARPNPSTDTTRKNYSFVGNSLNLATVPTTTSASLPTVLTNSAKTIQLTRNTKQRNVWRTSEMATVATEAGVISCTQGRSHRSKVNFRPFLTSVNSTMSTGTNPDC